MHHASVSGLAVVSDPQATAELVNSLVGHEAVPIDSLEGLLTDAWLTHERYEICIRAVTDALQKAEALAGAIGLSPVTVAALADPGMLDGGEPGPESGGESAAEGPSGSPAEGPSGSPAEGPAGSPAANPAEGPAGSLRQLARRRTRQRTRRRAAPAPAQKSMMMAMDARGGSGGGPSLRPEPLRIEAAVDARSTDCQNES